jgi:hypothetical protein
MAVCAGNKRDGSRCTATVEPPQTYCWWHDPDNAEERRRAASKAGKSRSNRELPDVKAQLQDLTRDVLAGDLETGRAAVANQLINTRLRAIEQQRKNKETEELEARIEALERASEQEKGVRPWRGA